MLELKPDETVAAYIAVKEFDEQRFVVMATRDGTIKKTDLPEFSNPRKAGIIAATVDAKDRLIEAKLTDGSEDVILATHDGQACRFHESDVRADGPGGRRGAGHHLREEGLRGGMVASSAGGSLLTVCENGFGKRTEIDEYRVHPARRQGRDHHEGHRQDRPGGGGQGGGGLRRADDHHRAGGQVIRCR